MASTAQQINSNQSSQNHSCAKRKKSKGSKGSFLSKWLDKTLHHDSGSFPSLDADMYVNPNVNWHTGNSQFGPGYDNYRHDMYGCTPGHTSLPTFLNHYNPMIPQSDYRYVQSENKRVQVQRPRVHKTNRGHAEEISSAPVDANHSHYFQPKTMSDSQDYTSLPPIITSTGDTNSVSDVHTNEKDESNGRRFSDPVVRGLPDVARPANGEVESDSDSESDLSGSQVGGRLLAYLLDQISSLKTANERINKELIETKAELETVRHQAFYPQAPNNFSSSNGVLGGQYSPGFLAELVREIRDAARIREEAMYARVRAMVHERLDSGIVSAESKISDRTLEEIKCSLRASEADRRRMMDRITKLEDELRTLRLTNGQEHTENRVTNGNDEDAECERLRLRKELADMRKAKQNAEENAHKLERLVTQMRSKFNGTQQNGPESLPSDPDEPIRIRRTSSSTNNSTGNLTNALNNSTNILNSTNVLSSNLHNSSTNALNSSNNLHHSSSNLINSSNNLHNTSSNLINSSNNLHNSSNMLNSSTSLLNSSSNLHNSSTNILNSSHNTNNSSFGHLTNASPMVFGLVTDL